MHKSILCVLFSFMSLTTARAGDRDAIVAKSAPTAMAVARLLCTEKWGHRADEILKASSAAESLGDRWTPDSDAWKQAKRVILSRITRVIENYEISGDMAQTLESDLASRLSESETTSIAAWLDGPAGGSVLRFEATTLFVSKTMADDPNSPASGQPGWMDQMRQIRAVFESSIGPDVPPGDPAQGEELKRYMTSSARQPLMLSLSSAVGKATTALDAAVQLDLFDSGSAIEKAIQEAVTKAAE